MNETQPIIELNGQHLTILDLQRQQKEAAKRIRTNWQLGDGRQCWECDDCGELVNTVCKINGCDVVIIDTNTGKKIGTAIFYDGGWYHCNNTCDCVLCINSTFGVLDDQHLCKECLESRQVTYFYE